MWQQGDEKGVSHRAVFVEHLASDDDDEGFIWVKIPRASIGE